MNTSYQLPEVNTAPEAKEPVKLKSFWVIAVEMDGIIKFLEEDENGDYFQTPNIPMRMVYHSLGAVALVHTALIDRSKETETDSAGVRRSHSTISRILGLSEKNPDVTAVLSIQEIEFTMIDQTKIRGRIQKPSGFAYAD